MKETACAVTEHGSADIFALRHRRLGNDDWRMVEIERTYECIRNLPDYRNSGSLRDRLTG